MSGDKKNDTEELLSYPSPPPYEIHPSSAQHQPLPTIIVNNTTVVQPVGIVPVVSIPVQIVDINAFCSDTPRSVRRTFIR